jgi:hypothetical protein
VLEVLSGRDQERLDVHLGQAAQPEAAEAMPVLGLPEQGLHPHSSLAHGLLVRRSAVICPHTIQVRGMEGAGQRAAVLAGRAGGLDRAGITGLRVGPVEVHFR